MTYINTARSMERKNAGARLDDHLELKEVMDALTKRDAEITAFAEKASAEIKDTGKIATETKAALDKLSAEGAATAERIQSIEQKLARRSFGPAQAKSFGAQFTESEAFKALKEGRAEKARMEVKDVNTIASLTTDADGSAGDAIVPHRVPGIVAPQDRVLTIRSLLGHGTLAGNSVEYVVERAFQNSAAPVAENPVSPKPQSDLSFDLKTSAVKTIAHWFKASKQVLDDIPMLQSYINGRAIYGLRYAEEQQLLNGTGASNGLVGIWDQATVFDLDLTDAADTKADILRRAIYQVRASEYRATGIVLHPQDWMDLELLKVGDDDNRYVWANPRGAAVPGLWGLPVVESMSLQPGDFLVGAFAQAATVWDRQTPTVEVATQHDEDFTHNLITIRAESRLALTVERPTAIIKGNFDLDTSPYPG